MSAPPPSHDLDEVAPIPNLPGPGEQLRTAREAAGISVHEISTHVRLDSRVIHALEADDYEALPAPTFVRGYLRGYARLLDLSPQPVLQAFEQRELSPPSLVADISVKSQIRSGDFPFRIVTYVVVVALVVLVVLWWRSQDFDPMRFDVIPEGEPETSEAETFLPAGESAVLELETPPLSVEPEASEPEASEPEAIVPLDRITTEAPAPAASEGETTGAAAGEEAPAGETEASAFTTAEESSVVEALSTEAPEPSAPPEAPETVAEQAADAAGAGEESVPTSAPVESPASEEAPPAEERPPEAEESQTLEARAEAAEGEPETVPGDDSMPAEASVQPGAGEAPAEASEEASPPSIETAEESSSVVAGAPTDRLEMRFSVECWLEVYDQTDERLFYGLAQPGDQLNLSGYGPIRLVLGNSEGVEMNYNGIPVDFTDFVTRGVARFSVGGAPPTAFRTPSSDELGSDGN